MEGTDPKYGILWAEIKSDCLILRASIFIKPYAILTFQVAAVQ